MPVGERPVKRCSSSSRCIAIDNHGTRLWAISAPVSLRKHLRPSRHRLDLWLNSYSIKPGQLHASWSSSQNVGTLASAGCGSWSSHLKANTSSSSVTITQQRRPYTKVGNSQYHFIQSLCFVAECGGVVVPKAGRATIPPWSSFTPHSYRAFPVVSSC